MTKEEQVRLTWAAHYWQAQHYRALQRIHELEAENAVLRATNRELTARLYERKSEKGHGGTEATSPEPSIRPRGQQAGTRGHGRRDYSHLPVEEEFHELPEAERVCPRCGLPLEAFPGTEDSEVIEVAVRAYRRVIRRARYRRSCSCTGVPVLLTAPSPPKLIPKGHYGVSVWVSVLLDKYQFLRPLHRGLEDWKSQGLDLAVGTMTGGLKKLLDLLTPIQEALVAKNREANRWHADETRWRVFTETMGKTSHRWYMWVFRSPETVVYQLDPSRSARVPKAHYEGVEEGILNVDRYASYKALARQGKIVLAFCWAHVRRDFIKVRTGWKAHEAWANAWLERIGQLYHLNRQRLRVRDTPAEFAEADRTLREAVQAMATCRETELAALPNTPAATPQRKVLESLRRHWEGLTVFVEHPEVPMDNNEAERLERTPAVARKNFYGSAALWSGQLAAVMFSIIQTLALTGLNPRLWLTLYLDACAANHGQVPNDFQRFLPWNLSPEQRRELALVQKPPLQDSS
jgi:transposase